MNNDKFLLTPLERRETVIERAKQCGTPAEALCRAQLAKLVRLLSGRLNPDDEAQMTREATTVKTTVVNIRQKGMRYDVYIGRGSPFGNPCRLGADGTREEVIVKFRWYFLEKLRTRPEFRRQVVALKGKVLGCYCKPLACHGDVIVKWLDKEAHDD